MKVGKFPFAGNSKATIVGSHDGFVKIVADAKYGEILGIHIIGPQATELIAEAVAVTGIERWFGLTGPGRRPSERRTASTAATSDKGGPNSRPNCPGRRKRWKFGELRRDREVMNAVTADGSGSFSVTSR